MAEPITKTVAALEARVEMLQTLTELMFVQMITAEAEPVVTIRQIRDRMGVNLEAAKPGKGQMSAMLLRDFFAQVEHSFAEPD